MSAQEKTTRKTSGAAKPVVAIAPGLDEAGMNARVKASYAAHVREAGGIPLILAPTDNTQHAAAALACANALILTGGDDPATEPFGTPTNPRANVVHPLRQAHDLLLLGLAHEQRMPTLGVCLGMQYMALLAGGDLDQHMPDTTPTHADHIDDRQHDIIPEHDALFVGKQFPSGTVTSWHRQAVTSPGSLAVLARAHDGVIEAIADPTLPYYLGVQWHPERSTDDALGLDIFRQLVQASHPN